MRWILKEAVGKLLVRRTEITYNFVRYADDCIIMVGSEMSTNRVMRNISRFIEEKLGLNLDANVLKAAMRMDLNHCKQKGYP